MKISRTLLCTLLLCACVTSNPPATSTPSPVPNTPVPASTETQIKQGPTFTATPDPTATPSFTATATATIPIPVTPVPTTPEPVATHKAVLVDVRESKSGRPRGEVWLLDTNETRPHVLLQNTHFSFEQPRWSHDGGLIAYEQRGVAAAGQSYIGIVQSNGENSRLVSTNSFSSIFSLAWSSDDRWLTFITMTSDGDMPYSIDVRTGELVSLLPLPSTRYSRAWLQPSPTANKVFLAGLVLGQSNPTTEMWLISLGNSTENVRIIAPDWASCRWIANTTWAPSGHGLLVQPGSDTPQTTCPPSLWMYDLATSIWRQVASAPNGDSRYLYLSWIDWSPNDQWVIWSDTSRGLIYATDTWQQTQELDLRKRTLMLSPWTLDAAGNLVLLLAERDFSQPPRLFKIWAVSFSGAATTESVLAKILLEPKWLPAGMTYEPLSLQP